MLELLRSKQRKQAAQRTTSLPFRSHSSAIACTECAFDDADSDDQSVREQFTSRAVSRKQGVLWDAPMHGLARKRLRNSCPSTSLTASEKVGYFLL